MGVCKYHWPGGEYLLTWLRNFYHDLAFLRSISSKFDQKLHLLFSECTNSAGRWRYCEVSCHRRFRISDENPKTGYETSTGNWITDTIQLPGIQKANWLQESSTQIMPLSQKLDFVILKWLGVKLKNVQQWKLLLITITITNAINKHRSPWCFGVNKKEIQRLLEILFEMNDFMLRGAIQKWSYNLI